MGIQGMHQAIKPYMQPVHISKFAGRRVGCDGYAWLHRGAVSCAQELHIKPEGSRWWDIKGDLPPYVSFCMRMVRMMRAMKVTPVVVLDGGKLPAKQATQEERRSKKAAALEKATAAVRDGDQAAADALFMQTLDVTPEMAHELVGALSQAGVEFLVAPYEADPQLALLSQMEEAEGGVAAVVTEDSDLMVYGCRRVVYKLDSHGNGMEFELEWALGPPPERLMPEVARGAVLSFRGFCMDMLRTVCVLAGCDFLPSVRGMGFKRAHSLVKRFKTLDRVLAIMKFEKGLRLTPDYPSKARRAFQGFCHPSVFDPRHGRLTRLQGIPESLAGCDLRFLGEDIPEEVSRGVAAGRLHPWPPHAPLPPIPCAPCQTAGWMAPLQARTWMISAAVKARSRSLSAQLCISPQRKARAAVANALQAARGRPSTPCSRRQHSLAELPAAVSQTPFASASSCESIPGDTPVSSVSGGRRCLHLPSAGRAEDSPSARARRQLAEATASRAAAFRWAAAQACQREPKEAAPRRLAFDDVLPEIEGESPLAEVSAGGDSDAHQREAPRLGSLGPTANVTKDIQDTIPEQLTKAKTQWLGAPGGEPDPAAVGGGGQPQAHAAIAATSAVQVVTARLKKRKAETLAPAGNDQRRISAFFGKGPKTAIDTGHRSVLSQLVDERISCIAASANGRARKVGRKR